MLNKKYAHNPKLSYVGDKPSFDHIDIFDYMQFLASCWNAIARAENSTVSRIVRQVTSAIARKRYDFVKFPQSRQEKDEIKQGFYDLGGFPCVDGSHVRIIAPSENECNFVNRKGYHSINIPGICDHKGTVLLLLSFSTDYSNRRVLICCAHHICHHHVHYIENYY